MVKVNFNTALEERLHWEGYTAFWNEEPIQTCPYAPTDSISAEKRRHWVKGWAGGFHDYITTP